MFGTQSRQEISGVISSSSQSNYQRVSKTKSEVTQGTQVLHSKDKSIPETYDGEDVVLLYLESVALQNNGLVLTRNHRVLLRQDHTSLTDQVKILSGGPAGMVPLHSGFVGPGMLTAAVFGNVNSSPSFLNILAALRILAKKHTQGILVIVMNSMADRFTFGLASQLAALEGIKTMVVTVGEDCSGVAVSRVVGRRGLCGILFLQKIAGAMAEDNKTLFEIYYVLTALSGGSLGTVNVSIAEGNFYVGSGLMRKSRSTVEVQMNSITHIVRDALYYILEPAAPYSLHVGKDEQVAIVVNNLGRLSDFQMAIVTREVCSQLNAMGIDLLRVYSGTFLTSNTAKGFSVSLLKVNENLLRWLDCPVNVTRWPNNVNHLSEASVSFDKGCLSYVENTTSDITLQPVGSQDSTFDKKNLGPTFSFSEAEQVVNVLSQIVKTISDLEEHLNTLDFDHDYGSALKKFMLSIAQDMDQKTLNIVTPYGLLTHLAQLAATSMEGVSGAVYSVLFCSAAQSFVASSSHVPVCWCMWMDAATLARDALSTYTKVELGDYTMFDALHPFVESFKNSTVESFSAAVRAAIKGMEESASNHPQGLPDPGAYCLAVTFRVMLAELQIYLREAEVFTPHQGEEYFLTCH